jgi:DNA-directed RNA polymerase specialized sigma24 family protein
MTEELLGRGDPVIRRLQQAFAHEELATDLAAILQRAAHYQAGGPLSTQNPPRPGYDLTQADLVAARRREPAAVTRVYTAYAPALFRYFVAAVGDRHQAEDLTGTTFASAIEALPEFRGPVEALGGWLFQIARHDLYDHRRRQAGSRIEPLDDNPALYRLSPREQKILSLLAKGWSNRRIAQESFLSLHTVRTHVQNILVKLGVHSKLEAVALALEHGQTSDPQGLDPLPMESLEGTDVMAAFQRLSPDQREVLLLSMVAGLTASEVATALGKTVGQVKALRHRGLAGLAGALSHLAGQEEHQG